MPYLEISFSELSLPDGYVIPPLPGSPVSEWVNYRVRVPRKRVLALPPPAQTYPVQRREWPFGASALFAIAAVQWWAWELRVRVAVRERIARDEERLRIAEATMTMEWRVKRIIREVCLKHGVEAWGIVSDIRTSKFCVPRFEVCYRLSLLGLSFAQIGRRVGGRDHSTVIHAIKRHCEIARIPVPVSMNCKYSKGRKRFK